MKVTSERGENCEVMLTIEVEPERVETAVRQAARKVSQQTNIPGFRRGKAPYGIVLQMYGRQTLLEEAVEDLGDQVFKEALEETKVEPYAQAELIDVQLEPMVLKLRVPVAPVIELGDYRALRLEVPAIEVTDDSITQSLDSLRERNAAWVPVNRGAGWGDLVTFKTESDDEGADPRDVLLREESHYPVPGFGAQVLGTMAGDQRTVETSFPADWHDKERAGKTETLSVLVQEVKEKELPALEELPTLVGDYEDLDSLKASIRKELESQEQAKQDAELVQKALDVLSEQAKVEFPKELVEQELDEIMNRLETRLQQQRLDMESYLNVLKTSKEEYREQQRPEATKRVQRGLILGRLTELEKLAVQGEEVSREIEARVRPFAGEGDQLRDLLTSPAGMQYVASEVLTDKARGRLLAIVKGEAPEIEEQAEPASKTPEPGDVADTEPADATDAVDGTPTLAQQTTAPEPEGDVGQS